MPRNKISDLRDHLFETLEGLKNLSDPKADDCEKVDIDTAKQICNVADKITETYKVEVQAMDLTMRHGGSEEMKKSLQQRGILQIDKE